MACVLDPSRVVPSSGSHNSKTKGRNNTIYNRTLYNIYYNLCYYNNLSHMETKNVYLTDFLQFSLWNVLFHST